MMSSSMKVGVKGEAMVIKKLTDKEWAVAKPLLDLGVDLLACKIIDNKIKTLAFQVKTLATPSHEHKTCYGINFKKSKIVDGVYYVIACPSIGESVILTSEQLKKKSHLHRGRDREWDTSEDKWDSL